MLNWFGQKCIYNIWHQLNETMCPFIFLGRRNSLTKFSAKKTNVQPKNEESIYFPWILLQKYISTEQNMFHPKDCFSRKTTNEIVLQERENSL
jgi:hypothetical protein